MAMMQEKESEATDEVQEIVDSTPMSAGDPVAFVAAASVLYSWYNFYMKGNKQKGIFVGLWAPTLLAGASYLQQKSIIQKFKRTLSSF